MNKSISPHFKHYFGDVCYVCRCIMHSKLHYISELLCSLIITVEIHFSVYLHINFGAHSTVHKNGIKAPWYR